VNGSLDEPTLLPASFPSLLVNGSSGIAVGMATNMPPHNLGEIIDALIFVVNNPDATAKDLMEIVPGPDFPTGGFIYGDTGIKEAYRTGRGIIQMRARVNVEKHPRTGKQSLVITEIPYMVNKARLIEKIAHLVRDKKIEGISDIRDESDRDGMRVVIELKRDEIAEVVLNNLYLQTQMRSSFGVINLALVNGQPRVMPLAELMREFIKFRKEVVTRRLVFDLKKARERSHILEGLKIAIDDMDNVIKLIRASKGPQEARQGLIKSFKLSLLQANAILEMKLSRLTALERDKIIAEYNQIQAFIKGVIETLDSAELLMGVVIGELKELRERFNDERRTEIVENPEEITLEDVIAEEDMVVTISHKGYIKRNPTSLFRIQKRGGKGKTGMTTREEDFVSSLFVASTHSHIMFFTDRGKAFSRKVYELPQAGRAARGKAIVNILSLSQGEGISAFLPVKEYENGKCILMGTSQGTIKKTDLMSFSNIRVTGIIAVSLDLEDKLIGASLADGTRDVFIGTRNGMSIRFSEEDVREMGRQARGVRGIKLSKGDSVVAMGTLDDDRTILTVTEKGYGKRTKLSEYRSQSRGGSGIINIKVTDKNGPVVAVIQVKDSDEIMISTSTGKIIRIVMKDVSVIGRSTQGVKLMNISDGEVVTGIAPIMEKEDKLTVDG